jgi:hypothetical protein
MFKKYIFLFFTIFVFVKSFAQDKFSLEFSMGSNFAFSEITSSTIDLEIIERHAIISSVQGLYLAKNITNRYDLIGGVEFYLNGIKASTNTTIQKKLYDIPNLASGRKTFYYRHWSFPFLVQYNIKTNNTNLKVFSGLGYTYSRNGFVNPTCFSGTIIDDNSPVGSIFCFKGFNKISKNNFFFRFGIGYDYQFKKIGNLGVKADFSLGVNLIDEASYHITFLNGGIYETTIGNRGNRIGISVIYKRKVKK